MNNNFFWKLPFLLLSRTSCRIRTKAFSRRKNGAAAPFPPSPDRGRRGGHGHRISNFSQTVYTKSCKETENRFPGRFPPRTADLHRGRGRSARRTWRALLFSGGFQHIFNENAISFGGIIQQNMGHGPHQFSVLQDRAAAHE